MDKDRSFRLRSKSGDKHRSHGIFFMVRSRAASAAYLPEACLDCRDVKRINYHAIYPASTESIS